MEAKGKLDIGYFHICIDWVLEAATQACIIGYTSFTHSTHPHTHTHTHMHNVKQYYCDEELIQRNKDWISDIGFLHGSIGSVSVGRQQHRHKNSLWWRELNYKAVEFSYMYHWTARTVGTWKPIRCSYVYDIVSIVLEGGRWRERERERENPRNADTYLSSTIPE